MCYGHKLTSNRKYAHPPLFFFLVERWTNRTSYGILHAIDTNSKKFMNILISTQTGHIFNGILYDVNFSNWVHRWWMWRTCFRTACLIWRWTGLKGINTVHMQFFALAYRMKRILQFSLCGGWYVAIARTLLTAHVYVLYITRWWDERRKKKINEKLAITIIIMPFTCMTSQNWSIRPIEMCNNEGKSR